MLAGPVQGEFRSLHPPRQRSQDKRFLRHGQALALRFVSARVRLLRPGDEAGGTQPSWAACSPCTRRSSRSHRSSSDGGARLQRVCRCGRLRGEAAGRLDCPAGELQWQVFRYFGCARWLRAQGIKVGQVRDDFRGGRGWQEVDRARENQRPRPADRLQLEGRAARRAGPCGLDTNKVRRRSRLEEAVSESHPKHCPQSRRELPEARGYRSRRFHV